MERQPTRPLYEPQQERGNVTDKIVSIEAALNSIRDHLCAATARPVKSDARPQDASGKFFAQEEGSYRRLFRALEDMRVQLEHHVRPVAEQVVQAEVERLRDLSKHHKEALQECLSKIDQSILGCRNQVNAYRDTCSDLVDLNARLAKLGVDPVPIPQHIPVANFEDVIKARVEELQSKGKF